MHATDHGPTTTLGDLTLRQVTAIDRFSARRRALERAAARERGREARMDLSRQLAVVRRQHAVIVARADSAVLTAERALDRLLLRTAVIAHRQRWFVDHASAALARHGIVVLGHTDVGADAVGWAIAEQPDVVLVEDKLAMVPGEEVVRQIRQFCDHAVIAVHASDSAVVGSMLDAGASAVHTRRVPPAEVVDQVVTLAGL